MERVVGVLCIILTKYVNAARKYKFQIIKNACHENVLLYNGNKTFITMTN